MRHLNLKSVDRKDVRFSKCRKEATPGWSRMIYRVTDIPDDVTDAEVIEHISGIVLMQGHVGNDSGFTIPWPTLAALPAGGIHWPTSYTRGPSAALKVAIWRIQNGATPYAAAKAEGLALSTIYRSEQYRQLKKLRLSSNPA